MLTTRLLAPSLALLVTASLVGCDDGSDVDATLEVSNESDFVIEEIYLTTVDSSTWGPNQLGSDVLFPDESFTLSVECDFYDALLVDEDGVECELHDLDLCLNDSVWVITNNTCGVFSSFADTSHPGGKWAIWGDPH